MSKVKYTEEIKQKVISLRNEGKSSTEIEQLTGMKKPSQDALYRERGIKMSKEHYVKALGKRWENYDPIPNGNKVCSKCKKDLPLEKFHKARGRASGLVSACVDCSSTKHIIDAKTMEEIQKKAEIWRNENKQQDKPWQKNQHKIVKKG